MQISDKRLLSTPVGRAAYSDRTAWLMAEMSALAYEKFESRPELLDEICERLVEMDSPKGIREEIETFVQEYLEPSRKGLDSLQESLSDAGFKLSQHLQQWRHPGVSREARVRPCGRSCFPRH